MMHQHSRRERRRDHQRVATSPSIAWWHGRDQQRGWRRQAQETMEMMARKIRLCEAACVCIIIAFASPGIAKSREHSQLVDTGVIFSAKQVERSAELYRMLTPPFWTPSTEEIARLEIQLKPYLEGVAIPEAKVIAAKLGRYKRQYLGYTDGGKKWI